MSPPVVSHVGHLIPAAPVCQLVCSPNQPLVLHKLICQQSFRISLRQKCMSDIPTSSSCATTNISSINGSVPHPPTTSCYCTSHPACRLCTASISPTEVPTQPSATTVTAPASATSTDSASLPFWCLYCQVLDHRRDPHTELSEQLQLDVICFKM